MKHRIEILRISFVAQFIRRSYFFVLKNLTNHPPTQTISFVGKESIKPNLKKSLTNEGLHPILRLKTVETTSKPAV